jgi:hypothetical protein
VTRLLDFGGAADALLDLIVSCAAEVSVALPARQYLAPGLGGMEAWDCEQVTVACTQVGPWLSANPTKGAVSSWGFVPLPSLQLRAEIVRCCPVQTGKTPPTPDDITAAAETALQDAALLHLVRARWGASAPGEPTDVQLGVITPTGPFGGYSSTTLVVAVTVTSLVAAPVPPPVP